MKMIVCVLGLLAAGATAGAAGASMLLGPKGDFKTSIGRLEYDPSRGCSKPMRPFSKDEYAQKMYIDDAKRYLTCLQESAESDAKYANDVIADGLQQSSDDFVREVERGY
jgi:hypothetical protein